MKVEERHPLKQGLKPPITKKCSLSWSIVEERHPLKQGLKLISVRLKLSLNCVEERHPLKQGLKQHYK